MVKHLTMVGNSAALVIDKPILQLLKIDMETQLDISTDGKNLIITPIRKDNIRKKRIKEATARILKEHGETFRRLAESDKQ